MTGRLRNGRRSTRAGRFARPLAVVIALTVLVLSSSTVTPKAVAGPNAGVLAFTPAYLKPDSTVTISLTDADLGVGDWHMTESAGTSGPYAIPAGPAGTALFATVAQPPIADVTGDRLVTTVDIQSSNPQVSVTSVDGDSGQITVVRGVSSASPTAFTLMYKSDVIESAFVKITSSSDPVGFNLSLRETDPKSNTFTATITVAPATAATNAGSPLLVPRPSIAGITNSVVIATYSDSAPAGPVTSAARIDGVKPLVTIVSPANNVATNNVVEWAVATITDAVVGVELSQVVFNIDLDRDGIFGEPGESAAPDLDQSTPIANGWRAAALLPAVYTDGYVRWYVTAADRSGNIGRTDSDTSTTGDQDHSFRVDTTPPRLISALIGPAYDDVAKVILPNRRDSARIIFNEALSPIGIVPGNFVFGNMPASVGKVYASEPNSLWLTVPGLSATALPLTMSAGGVTDVAGFKSEYAVITPEDRLGPRLNVVLVASVTNGPLNVSITSDEDAVVLPTLAVNGITVALTTPEGPRSWKGVLDPLSVTAAALGDGVKNVEAFAIDAMGNLGRGGVPTDALATAPGAVRYELDRLIKPPVISPVQGVTLVSNVAAITVSYLTERAEYTGDTHHAVTLVSASLNGNDIIEKFSYAPATGTFTYAHALSQGPHTLVIQGRDDANNIHAPVTVQFTVVAPTPTPTMTSTPTLTPVPTATSTATPTARPATATATVAPVPTATKSPTPAPTAVVPTATAASVSPTPVPSATAIPTPSPQSTGTPTGQPADSTPEPGTGPSDGSGQKPEIPELTEDDIQATVAAMREEEALEETVDSPPGKENVTVYGCNVPFASAKSSNGDYMIAGAGLLALAFVARRRRGSG